LCPSDRRCCREGLTPCRSLSSRPGGGCAGLGGAGDGGGVRDALDGLPNCDGSGYTTDASGESVICPMCDGTGSLFDDEDTSGTADGVSS
jgi:hypothetical protein